MKTGDARESLAGRMIRMIRSTRYRWRLTIAMLVVSSAVGHSIGRAETDGVLLSPRRGQLPSDVGSDDRSKLRLVRHEQLEGKVLQVDRLPGDSFGDRVPRVRNWKPFVSLQFDAFNPGKAPVSLTLTVLHRRTTSYPTRVDMPFRLKPGKNHVALGIDDMTNVNGSVPDLTQVARWYISCDAKEQAATLFFGEFRLVGAAPSARRNGPSPAAVPYRIRGRVGKMKVDLMVEPVTPGRAGPASAVHGVKTDPQRLARIRAATMPAIERPVPFDTPQADAIAAALEVFPPDHPFNQLVEDWPVHPRSDAIIDSIGRDKPLRYNPDMSYIFVPPDQPKVDVRLTLYPDESDPGPYPVPPKVPIEGWPAGFAQFHADLRATLQDVQRDRHRLGGDRHAIVVDPVRRMLYEFYQMKRTDRGWQASNAAVWDLKSNRSRPEGWTSADAAGLPIFPAVVRYDELKRGVVEHAMRVTVRRTRRAYVAPATHYASRYDNPSYPRMGERLRLKASFDISGFSPPVRTILRGLQRYGMLVADNGIDWAISVAPDPRIPDLHAELRRIPGSAFEVVVAPGTKP